MQGSGNCYKLRLALHQTKTPFRLCDIDVLKGESRTEEFLAKNANGKVPLLALDDGRYLPESNAGLYYVANGSALLPDDFYDRAQVLQWMFFEQYSHEPYIAVARYWWSIAPGGREEKAADFDQWRTRGYQALDVMEQHLTDHEFFAANRYTIADIALYAYTHVAHEGTFDLSSYRSINDWLSRIRKQCDHVPIDWRP
jgi:glutathione S-transferase